jgi:ribosomal protein L24
MKMRIEQGVMKVISGKRKGKNCDIYNINKTIWAT